MMSAILCSSWDFIFLFIYFFWWIEFRVPVVCSLKFTMYSMYILMYITKYVQLCLYPRLWPTKWQKGENFMLNPPCYYNFKIHIHTRVYTLLILYMDRSNFLRERNRTIYRLRQTSRIYIVYGYKVRRLFYSFSKDFLVRICLCRDMCL